MRSLTTWHRQMKDQAPRTVGELPGSVWGLKAGASHVQSGGHFPHNVPGVGTEIVTAADAPHAPHLGLDLWAELDAVRLSRDDRVLYAICSDQMFSSYAAHGYPAYTWRPYNPGDPNRDRHYEHGHLQVVDDPRGDDPRPWATSTAGADDMDAEQGRKLSAIDQTVWDAIVNGSDTTTTDVPLAGGRKPRPVWLVTTLRQAAADAKAGRVAVEALAAALNSSGGDLDTAAIIAHMDRLAATEIGQVQSLLELVNVLEGELQKARRAMHAATAEPT